MEDEKKLAAAAFAVFADRLASEVATDVEKLQSEHDRLAALLDLLGKVEIHAGGQIVASSNLNDAVITEEEHLMIGFVTQISTSSLPLSNYCRGNGAKIVVANQTVGSLPGLYPSDVNFIEGEVPETRLSMTAGERGSYVSLDGALKNLTDDDMHNLATDEALINRYLATGEGLESSDVTFTPYLVHMQMTPGLQRICELCSPLKLVGKDGPVSDHFDESPSDTLRDIVARACGSSGHLGLAEKCMLLKYKVELLSQMRDLAGAVELYSDEQETPFRISLEEGHLNGSGLWSLCCPSGSPWSIPVEKMNSLQVSLSGATLEKESFNFATAPSGGHAMRIFFHSGITVTGFFEGPGAEHDSIRQVMHHIMNTDGQIQLLSTPLRFNIVLVTIDCSSIENLLHILGINVQSNIRKVELKDPGEMSIRELKAEIAEAGLEERTRGFVEKREFVDLVRQHREGML